MELTELLNQGIMAARAGQRVEARQFLAQVVRTNPRHEQGWLWLSVVLDDTKQAVECLERVLTLNPYNQQARDRLETLKVVQMLQVDANASSDQDQGDFRLGEWLVRHGLLKQEALDKALKEQQKVRRMAEREPLGTILLRHKAITPNNLAEAIEHQIVKNLGGQIGDGMFRQIGYYLVKHGYLSPTQLAQAITRQTVLAQKGKRVRLGELLVNERLIRREQLDQALQSQRLDYDRQFGGTKRG